MLLLLTFLLSCGNRKITSPFIKKATDAPCRFDFKKIRYEEHFVEDENIKCGDLEVPENREKKNSNTIFIHYAIVNYHQEKPINNIPIVLLPGGPGGNSLDLLPVAFGLSQKSRKEVIVYDPRGVGYSHPTFPCDTNEGPLENCIIAFEKEGHDLAGYNSFESAADLASLAGSLGYSQLDLFGGSYGTYTAATMMREYPHIVRSAILDGPFLPSITYANYALYGENILSRYFSYFKNYYCDFIECPDGFIAMDFPTELKTFVDRIKKDPIKFSDYLIIDSFYFESILFGDIKLDYKASLIYLLIYYANRDQLDEYKKYLFEYEGFDEEKEFSRQLDKALYFLIQPNDEIDNNNWNWQEVEFPEEEWEEDPDDGVSEFVNFLVRCQDILRFLERSRLIKELEKYDYSKDNKEFALWEFELCKEQNHPNHSKNDAKSLWKYKIPTLILAGGLDNNTPVELLKPDLSIIKNFNYVEIDCYGHVFGMDIFSHPDGFLQFSLDTPKINSRIESTILDFLKNPNQELDTSYSKEACTWFSHQDFFD